jgi:hypothetical protein
MMKVRERNVSKLCQGGNGGEEVKEEVGRKKSSRLSEASLHTVCCVWRQWRDGGENKNGGSHQGRPWWLLVFGETGLTESTT